METKREQITTEVVFNGDRTYEIKRRIEGYKGDKAILIGLYPTIDGDNITKIDSTQLHLINHMKEMGLSEVRIMNLYSEVFERKPTVSQLTYDTENFEYISKAVNEADTDSCKLIIAYGSSLGGNKMTNTIKHNLLTVISKSRIKNNVYQIGSEYNDTISSEPTHVLYLGLRHGDERWNLMPLDVNAEKEKIALRLTDNSEEKMEPKRKGRKRQDEV